MEVVNIFGKNMKIQERNIFLLVDNIPLHAIHEDLEHIKISFLPPNSTSRLQLMDGRIINSFKCNYKNFFLVTIGEIM